MLGFKGLVLQKAPHVTFVHCIVHRHALASKTLPSELLEALQVCINNFIKNRSLNQRLFKFLCADHEASQTVVLFHTEVRWLSRGNMINRLLELRNEVTHFLQLHNKNLYEKWIDKSLF